MKRIPGRITEFCLDRKKKKISWIKRYDKQAKPRLETRKGVKEVEFPVLQKQI